MLCVQLYSSPLLYRKQDIPTNEVCWSELFQYRQRSKGSVLGDDIFQLEKLEWGNCMLELQRVQIRHKILHIRYDLATSGSSRVEMNSNEVSKYAIVSKIIHPYWASDWGQHDSQCHAELLDYDLMIKTSRLWWDSYRLSTLHGSKVGRCSTHQTQMRILRKNVFMWALGYTKGQHEETFNNNNQALVQNIWGLAMSKVPHALSMLV